MQKWTKRHNEQKQQQQLQHESSAYKTSQTVSSGDILTRCVSWFLANWQLFYLCLARPLTLLLGHSFRWVFHFSFSQFIGTTHHFWLIHHKIERKKKSFQWKTIMAFLLKRCDTTWSSYSFASKKCFWFAHLVLILEVWSSSSATSNCSSSSRSIFSPKTKLIRIPRVHYFSIVVIDPLLLLFFFIFFSFTSRTLFIPDLRVLPCSFFSLHSSLVPLISKETIHCFERLPYRPNCHCFFCFFIIIFFLMCSSIARVFFFLLLLH